MKCHSTAKHKGDLDLEKFGSIDAIRQDSKTWEEVYAQVASGEMPPHDVALPTPEQRAQFLSGVNAALDEVARSMSGDPGPVVLRRLSNAEYTYSVRDLTGVPTLDPVREFPADGASGEGFMNVGNSLVMSPSLISKYLDAAKEIASHAVLLPDSIRFSPHATLRDWTDQWVAEIRSVYRAYTDPRGGDLVNLQGIVFATNEGGRLPLDKYLAASLELRDAETNSVDTVAATRGLSPKYLRILLAALKSASPSQLLDPIRAHWRMAGAADVPALASEIAAWQKALWRFSPVGHIGKAGGPKRWMEPVTPLAHQQEFRLKLAPTNATDSVTVYLVVGDAGDGNEQDIAVWGRPRLVATGRPDVSLRDLRGACRDIPLSPTNSSGADAPVEWGVDPAYFGWAYNGATVDPESLTVHAPFVLPIRIPAQFAAGAEMVTTGSLASKGAAEGSVQFQILTNRPSSGPALWSTGTTVSNLNVPWTSNGRQTTHASPIIVKDDSAVRRRLEAAMDEYRQLFPAALCYDKIVPVDEVITLTLFYREDDQLSRLMLDAGQQRHLDRLWDELHFVSRDALTELDGFEQLWQFATQDADPKVFEPLREPLQQRAAAFRQMLKDAEPKQLDAVLDFAHRAYRRPLEPAEREELRNLYSRLRHEELSHEEALRLTLARVLVSPAFLYHAETPVAGKGQGPIPASELASRLSYFLWSSEPDAELRAVVDSGQLTDPKVLTAQAHRMLQDPKVRRLATEFACAWLHIYAFDESAEKSERTFPTFPSLKAAMYEETIRFFTDFFQHDRSVLDLVAGDSTYLNEAMARHYGVPGVTGPEWRRVDSLRSYGRGGILGQASVLAQNSGASRTSPILRGNWVSEVLLGEKLPRPPKDVPKLPEEESTTGLTMRELTQRHTSDPRCAGCHARIDAFGFALEGFDAIGRRRDRDSGDRPIDTWVRVMDGSEFDGIEGLRGYLLRQRRDAFMTQFCRKLLGYSLGRAVQLSDRPVIAEMRARLEATHYQVGAAIEVIVTSRPFREIRGRDFAGPP